MTYFDRITTPQGMHIKQDLPSTAEILRPGSVRLIKPENTERDDPAAAFKAAQLKMRASKPKE